MKTLSISLFSGCILCILLLYPFYEAQGQCTVPITTFPYAEDFEMGSNGWFSGGVNNDWAMGSPVKPVISSAGSGAICWISGGLNNSFYNYGERSWVQSPCFDISALQHPVVKVLVFWDTEYQYDGGGIQYSNDGGLSWKNLGSSQSTGSCYNQNWFNYYNITNLNGLSSPGSGWSGTIRPGSGPCRGGNGSGQWMEARYCLEGIPQLQQIIFRFTFGAGTTCNDYDGLAFDNFRIEEAQAVASDFNWVCTGPSTVLFNDLQPGCHATWTWDFGDPASPSNSSTVPDPEHVFSAPGTYNITLTAEGACTPGLPVSKQVRIAGLNLSTTDVTCTGGNDGTATAAVSGAIPPVTYAWNTIPVQAMATATGLQEGTYTVTVSSSGACDVSGVVGVTTNPAGHPVISLGKDTTLCPGSELFLAPGKFAAYVWQDASTDSVFPVTEDGKYWVTVTNTLGCEASDTIRVTEDCLGDIMFPDAFTPNGDGKNDIFLPSGSHAEEYSLAIFNRWGVKIFESNHQETGWDGTFRNSAVPEGIYVYLTRYSIGGRIGISKKGSILIIR